MLQFKSGLLLLDIAGSEQLLLDHIKASLDEERLPNVTATFTGVNMWGLRNVPAISVKSKLGCDVSGAICVMRYGRHVVVGMQVSGFLADFSQSLAASCFVSIVRQCIEKAIEATAAKLNREVRCASFGILE